ncbi:MAG: transcriptional regulator [Methanomicrobiaceae archaeon]|nr:transcriptional regulator [Methanomicrobiaceae archaeon]
MKITHIIFVGHHKERLIQSLKMSGDFPMGKIILVVGEQSSSGEEKSRILAEDIKKDLSSLVDTEIVSLDKKDVKRGAMQLISLIKSEEKFGFESVINISGSLRTFAVSAYIAGSVTRSRVITSIPRYDENDNEVGIEEVIEVPVLPVCFLRDEQMQIILSIDEGVDSLDELIMRINPSMEKYTDEFYKERSRVSHHLKVLEGGGFIEKNKKGRNISVSLSDLGILMSQISDCEV